MGILRLARGVVGASLSNGRGKFILNLSIQKGRVETDTNPIAFNLLVKIVPTRDQVDRIGTGMGESVLLVSGREILGTIFGTSLELACITHMVNGSRNTEGKVGRPSKGRITHGSGNDVENCAIISLEQFGWKGLLDGRLGHFTFKIVTSRSISSYFLSLST